MKKIVLFIFIVLIALGGWCYYASTTSNPWNAATVADIPTPLGYSRINGENASYTQYLRSLPLKSRGTKVHLYTGGEAGFQIRSTAVIDMKLLSNSEQCADATMRLRAEYLWQQGRYRDIHFRNVNGKQMRYSGGQSRKAFESYMRGVYGLCSTYSLYHETEPRAIRDVQPGDVLVYPARNRHWYGHALIVIDVAKNCAGKVAILCAEGSTPACDIHLVRNLNPLKNPWFFLDEDDDPIWISVFRFNKNELRHY